MHFRQDRIRTCLRGGRVLSCDNKMQCNTTCSTFLKGSYDSDGSKAGLFHLYSSLGSFGLPTLLHCLLLLQFLSDGHGAAPLAALPIALLSLCKQWGGSWAALQLQFNLSALQVKTASSWAKINGKVTRPWINGF